MREISVRNAADFAPLGAENGIYRTIAGYVHQCAKDGAVRRVCGCDGTLEIRRYLRHAPPRLLKVGASRDHDIEFSRANSFKDRRRIESTPLLQIG